MAKNQKINTRIHLAVLIFICLIFFAPFFINPQELTTKDNDLGRTYIPIFNFITNSFYESGQIPLWRPDQLMGETFVGNPLSALFYPLNIIFIILPLHLSAVIYVAASFLLAAIFTFFLARNFSLSTQSSLAAAVFYAFSTKMIVHLEAGHATMLVAFAYFPLAFLAVRKLLVKLTAGWLTLGALSLTFIYFTYPTIFYYTIIFLTIYWFYQKLPKIKVSLTSSKIASHFLPLIILFLATIGLSSIVLLPQIEFAPLSTRTNLKLEDVAQPLWNVQKFATSLIFPYLDFKNLSHESFLYLGLVPSALAIFGFFHLSKSQKIVLSAFGVLTLFYVSGLSSPIFPLAYDYLPFLKYSRITTRLWFVVALVVALLSAFALEKIKTKRITHLLILLFLVESFSLGYQRLSRISNLAFDNQLLYQKIAQPGVFRVYCTSYCFNPQLISKYKIEVLHGETPIQHAAFIDYLAQAGNYQYQNFAVIFPPYQVWQNTSPPIPDARLLGAANVKYVTSTYDLNSPDLNFVENFGNLRLYQNKKYQPRAYFETEESKITVSDYSPNRILLKFSPMAYTRSLILAENYYPGWFAYANNQKFAVRKHQSVFRKVIVPPNSNELELKYQPQSYLAGKAVTIATVLVLLLYICYSRQRKNYG